jgi:ribonucleoside-diphosphate reductase alpha chain
MLAHTTNTTKQPTDNVRDAAVKLPSERPGKTLHFSIGGHDGYLIYNVNPETGELAEISIRMAKVGSTVWGWTDAFAIVASIALQRGEPLHELARHFVGSSFEPAGFCMTDGVMATSVLDFVFRKLLLTFPVKR